MVDVKRLASLAALVTATALAACSDSTGPGPEAVNPQEMATGLAAVTATFNNNAAFQSLANLSTVFPRFGATAALRATLPSGALAPRAPGGDALAPSGAGGRESPRILADRAPAAPLALFPSDVLGKTFVWNPTTDAYEMAPSRTGAPINGIRIILYVTDGATGLPVEQPSLLELGYVELTDEGTALGEKLGVLLKLGTQTIADYDISLSVATTAVNLRARGFVKGATGADTVKFDLNNTVNLTTGAATLDYDLSGPNGVTLRFQVTGSASSQTVTFRITKDGNSIEMAGTLGSTVNVTVKYNGVTVATITGASDNPTFTGAGGRTLTAQEIQALTSIFEAAGQVLSDFIEAIFRPLEVVFSS